jgi:NAD(P)-dependent dehydrogenase (short-subunit alcohol dehydrogenase family)
VDSAVVTGAGRGLGRAIAARLARRGLAVTATDVDAEGAARTAEEIGNGATSTRLDVRAGLRLLPAFRKLGERNRERWRKAG